MPLHVSASQPPRADAAALVVDFPVALAAGVMLACAAVAMALGAYWVTRPTTDPPIESATRGAPGALRVPWSAFAGDGVAYANELVFITTAPADGSLAPAERPSVLYARFVAADARSAPGGLIRRRFRDGTPFEGEDLVVAAPDGRAFWARCPGAGSPAEAGGRCMTEMRFGDTDVQVRFAPALLQRWEILAGGVQRRLAPPAAPIIR